MLFQHIPKCRSTHIQPAGGLALVVVLLLQDETDHVVLDVREALLKVDRVVPRGGRRDAAARLLRLLSPEDILHAGAVDVGAVRAGDQRAHHAVELREVAVPREVLHPGERIGGEADDLLAEEDIELIHAQRQKARNVLAALAQRGEPQDEGGEVPLQVGAGIVIVALGGKEHTVAPVGAAVLHEAEELLRLLVTEVIQIFQVNGQADVQKRGALAFQKLLPALFADHLTVERDERVLPILPAAVELNGGVVLAGPLLPEQEDGKRRGRIGLDCGADRADADGD